MDNDRITEVLASSLHDSNRLRLGFENAERYNEALAHTFLRTVSDLARMTQGLNLDKVKVLEIGSFTGVVSVALRRLGFNVTASDMPFIVEDESLRCFMLSEQVAILACDLATAKMPAPSDAFDIIIFNEVLEHLNFNPLPLLREFRRVLARGGKIYCATPNLGSEAPPICRTRMNRLR